MTGKSVRPRARRPVRREHSEPLQKRGFHAHRQQVESLQEEQKPWSRSHGRGVPSAPSLHRGGDCQSSGVSLGRALTCPVSKARRTVRAALAGNGVSFEICYNSDCIAQSNKPSLNSKFLCTNNPVCRPRRGGKAMASGSKEPGEVPLPRVRLRGPETK